MIVIRRMVDRRRAYTAIFLKGEPPKIFPTSDAEHARILQVYKQDKPHEGILNDFSDDAFLPLRVKAQVETRPRGKTAVAAKPPEPVRPAARSGSKKGKAAASTQGATKKATIKKPAKEGPLWLVVVPERNAPQRQS